MSSKDTPHKPQRVSMKDESHSVIQGIAALALGSGNKEAGSSVSSGHRAQPNAGSVFDTRPPSMQERLTNTGLDDVRDVFDIVPTYRGEGRRVQSEGGELNQVQTGTGETKGTFGEEKKRVAREHAVEAMTEYDVV